MGDLTLRMSARARSIATASALLVVLGCVTLVCFFVQDDVLATEPTDTVVAESSSENNLLTMSTQAGKHAKAKAKKGKAKSSSKKGSKKGAKGSKQGAKKGDFGAQQAAQQKKVVKADAKKTSHCGHKAGDNQGTFCHQCRSPRHIRQRTLSPEQSSTQSSEGRGCRCRRCI